VAHFVSPACPALRAASAGSGTPVAPARVKPLHSARPIMAPLSAVALRSRPLQPKQRLRKERTRAARVAPEGLPSLHFYITPRRYVNFPRACAPSAPAPPPAALRTTRPPPRGLPPVQRRSVMRLAVARRPPSLEKSNHTKHDGATQSLQTSCFSKSLF